jgi:hypothetical protein
LERRRQRPHDALVAVADRGDAVRHHGLDLIALEQIDERAAAWGAGRPRRAGAIDARHPLM